MRWNLLNQASSPGGTKKKKEKKEARAKGAGGKSQANLLIWSGIIFW